MNIFNDFIETLILGLIVVTGIIVLAVVGSLGMGAESIANQGISALALGFILILAIPPIGLFVWLITKIVNESDIGYQV